MPLESATWPTGTGEMAGRIRAHDWGATPLGPIDDWPQSQKTAVEIMLASGHAMQLAWGPERIILYNDAYAPMLGERHPSALGIRFQAAWPDVWNEIKPLVDRVFAGETVRFEDMPLIMTRHGYAEETWWNFSYSPVRDESGAVTGLLNVTVDATSKMRAERAERERDEANSRLREREEHLRALVNASSDVVYTMSPDWSEMRQLDGRGFIPNTEAHNIRWIDEYLFPEDKGPIRETIQKAIDGKEVFELEHRVRRADGSAGWTFSRAIPILGGDGEILRWFGMAADVSARRESEERRAYLLKLSDALRSLSDATEIKTQGSCVLAQQLDANRAFYAEVQGDDWLVEGGYAKGVAPLPAGRYSAERYGQQVMNTYRAGDPIVFCDTRTDPGLTDDEREAHRAIEIIGAIGVPLVKAGKLTAVLTVQTNGPRNWRKDEIALVEETAERTWAAVERARAEAALREREDKFRSLFESIDEGVFIAEPAARSDGLRDWLYVAMNERSHAMFGMPDLTGQSMRDNFPAEDEGWYDIYERVFESGGGLRFERGALSKGMILEMFVTRVETAARTRHLMVVMSDVTERRRVTDALRESEKRQSFLLKLSDALRPIADPADIQGVAARLLREQIDAGWCFYNEFDQTGTVATVLRDSVKEGLQTMVGVHDLSDAPQILSLLRAGELFNAPDFAAFPLFNVGFVERYRGTGIQAVLGVPLVKDGRLIAVLLVADTKPRTWLDSEVRLLTDVAERTWAAVERARAEAELDRHAAELRRSNEDLQEFAHVAAHDLESPLRIISTYAGLLQQRCKTLDATANEFIGTILDGVGAMQRLTRGLLQLAEAGQDSGEQTTMRAGAVVEGVLSDLRQTIEETGASVTYGELPTVRLEPLQLLQLIQNLVNNALKYRHPARAPRIHISAERRGDFCWFAVTDNGLGIDPKYHERVFAPLKRLHGGDIPGSGIGLSICKKIVERHGGRIWVESKDQTGSTFWFTLPAG